MSSRNDSEDPLRPGFGLSTVEPPAAMPTVDVDDDGPPQPGPTLPSTRAPGRFVVEEEVGRGGMGVVVRAHDTELRRWVAIKTLRADLPTNPTRATRFVAEAQLTAQLDHPAVVQVHDVGRFADGELFYVMKLVQGRTLTQILRAIRRGTEHDWPLRRLLRAFLQACDGVAYAHARGVVHRDLKPDNLIFGAFGEVYVLDWGVAAVLEGDDEPLERVDATAIPTTSVVGTAGYASPEQFALGQAVDRRTDVYSLGAILGNILTHRTPAGIDALHPDVHTPPELAAIGARARHDDPNQRYPSVHAFSAAIENWQEQESQREADRLGWSLRNVELSTLAMEARAVRIHDALSHLVELSRMLFEHPGEVAAIDQWLEEAGFEVDTDGYYQPRDLGPSIREGRASPRALSWCWPPSRASDPIARAHMHALRGIGPALRTLVDRVRDLSFVYYADAHNVALVFPADDMRAAVPSEFDFLSYPAFVTASPAKNPGRGLATTPPHVDYGNKGLITAMTLPVYVGETFVGAWCADVPLSVLHADVTLSQTDRESTLIVDRAGLLIARSGEAPSIDAEKGSVHTRRLVDEGGVLARIDLARVFETGHGEQRFGAEDGREVVVQYRVAPSLGWAICAVHRLA